MKTVKGHLGGSEVEYLPSAQGVIPWSWDQVPHRAPHGNLLLPLPVSLSLSVNSTEEENMAKLKETLIQ